MSTKLVETKLKPETQRQGATLKALREARGIPLGDFATKLGRSYSYVSNIEAGRKRLTPEIALKAAHLLAVSPIALLRPDEFGETA